MLAIIGYGAINWAVAYFGRVFGIAASHIGVTLGLISAFAGVLGTLFAGFFGDWLVARGIAGARLRVMQVAMVITVPMATFWSLMPTASLSLIALTVLFFAQVAGHSSVPVMIQEVVPNRMRGQIVAIYLLIAGLAGIALAPTVIALITDYVFRDEAAVGRSLSVVGLPASLIGLAVAFRSQRSYIKIEQARRVLP